MKNSGKLHRGICALIVMVSAMGAGQAIGKSNSESMVKMEKSTFDTLLESGALASKGDMLRKIASAINKRLPMTKGDMRLDSVSGSSNGMRYNYTALGFSAREINGEKFKKLMDGVLTNRVCTNKQMSLFVRNHIPVSYAYRGIDGQKIAVVTVNTANCGKYLHYLARLKHRRLERAELARAERVLGEGRYVEALDVLKELSPTPRHRAEFWLIEGEAYLGMGKLAPAERALAKARSLDPHNAELSIELAIVDQQRGEQEGALRILSEAEKSYPYMPEIYLNKGYSQLKLGRVHDARHSFKTFMRLTEGRPRYAEQRTQIGDWLN